mmetsp:Transcript_29971/g.45831  ORF Transcript_29971/g.45831 Transcript_29971/m.45831 type:complete len:127 (+) Transcript_29971:791-1171(+)
MDCLGSGNSGGTFGRLESAESLLQDLIKFHEVYCDHYQLGDEVPKFMMGHSMGGLLSTTIASLQPQLKVKYSGIILAAPYFKLHSAVQNKIDQLQPVVKMMVKVTPNKLLPFEDSLRKKKHLHEWR